MILRCFGEKVRSSSRIMAGPITALLAIVLATGCSRKSEKSVTSPTTSTPALPSAPATSPPAAALASPNQTSNSVALSNQLQFEATALNSSIKRDYDQTVMLPVQNDSAVSRTLAASASAHFEDLPADFTGPGSMDEPIVLEPGQRAELHLAITAADAQKDSYSIPITVGTISAAAVVHISGPVVQLAIHLVRENPATLGKTVEITNEGGTLSDFAVRLPLSDAKDVNLQPAVGHAYFPAGGKMQFNLAPVLYYEFEKLSTHLLCSAAGKQVDFPVEFAAPVGKHLIGYRTASQTRTNSKDWYCTNRPNTCSNLPAPPATGPTLAMLLASASSTIPARGACSECEQNKCCDDAKAAGNDNGDVGGIVCCDGKQFVCVWKERDGSAARDYIRNCIQKHEEKHKEQGGECNPDDGRFGPKNGGDLPARECAAFRTEIDCLKQSLKDCAKLPTKEDREDCISRVQNRITINTDLAENYYCKGKTPPEDYQPPATKTNGGQGTTKK